MGISLKNVSYSYRGKYQTVRAVDGVSYDFEPGKLYAIIGKSGSGKTTLMSLMAGLDLPTEGEIFVDGKSTREWDRNALRRDGVSVIYQNYNLFPLLDGEYSVPSAPEEDEKAGGQGSGEGSAGAGGAAGKL